MYVNYNLRCNVGVFVAQNFFARTLDTTKLKNILPNLSDSLPLKLKHFCLNLNVENQCSLQIAIFNTGLMDFWFLRGCGLIRPGSTYLYSKWHVKFTQTKVLYHKKSQNALSRSYFHRQSLYICKTLSNQFWNGTISIDVTICLTYYIYDIVHISKSKTPFQPIFYRGQLQFLEYGYFDSWYQYEGFSNELMSKVNN